MNNQLNFNANSIAGTNGSTGNAGATGSIGAEGHDSISKSKCCGQSSCTKATDGASGANGGAGTVGQDGSIGSNATMVTFRVKSYPQDLNVNISLNGGNGGNGGEGGAGGDGGIGGSGGETTGSGCKGETPANGGDGGNGANGNTGGTGGTGGDGGIGLVQYQSGNAQPLHASIHVVGGQSGAGGASGQGGAAGLGGTPGTSGDKSGNAGEIGLAGLTGAGGTPGNVGQNGQSSVSPAEVETFGQLIDKYKVPEVNQYKTLNGAVSLDVMATKGIVPFITTAGDMDTMRAMLGSASVRIPHLVENANLESLAKKSNNDFSASDNHALLTSAKSYLLGDVDKVASVTPLLNDTIANKDIAVFAISDLEIPEGGLSITTTDSGPKAVLLITEKLSTGDINVSPLITLTVNTDQLLGN